MVSICFYFQVHQPLRLRPYSVFSIGHDTQYFDDIKNKEIVHKVAQKCYLPANKLMLDLIRAFDGKFRISYSISGVALEQFERYAPEIIASFKELADTGCVEFLSETYYHSLSFFYSKEEFLAQVAMHKEKIQSLFGQTPTVFRNTELIFTNDLAATIHEQGYKAILAEGADHILGWRSPNFVYNPPNTSIKTLLKNYRLSDDIAFRFSEQSWKEFPLTTEKFAQWVGAVNGNGNVINLFMDYETFGEHQWEASGIFDFLRLLPHELLQHPHNNFLTPSQVAQEYDSVGVVDMHHPVSWADVERDTSAWLGNNMQQEAMRELYALEQEVKESNDAQLVEDWRRLTTSDHFYYMCTKWFADGDVHKYFNPYDSPYDAYITFSNVLTDVRHRLKNTKEPTKSESTEVAPVLAQ